MACMDSSLAKMLSSPNGHIQIPAQKSRMDIRGDVIEKLWEIGAVKFGDFTLKSGISSPFYIDLRLTVSYPNVLESVAELISQQVRDIASAEKVSVICGVPYTALPFATLVSASKNIPMVMRRKEAKNYGTKKMVEGVYKSGDSCLVIEDIITSGASIMETVQDLKNEGLNVSTAVVVVNREQGGVANCTSNGINIKSIFTISEIVDYLHNNGKIDEEVRERVLEFIKEHQVSSLSLPSRNSPEVKQHEKTFEQRRFLTQNVLLKRLFSIMCDKQTTLALSADVSSADELLEVARVCGPHICVLKTHQDIVTPWTREVEAQLAQLAHQLNFLIMEDRKFADIGAVTARQYEQCSVRWAHLVTVHPLPGKGVLQGLAKTAREYKGGAARGERAAILVCDMSSNKDDIFQAQCRPPYTQMCLEMAKDSEVGDFVAGFVTQSLAKERREGKFCLLDRIVMTPGVSLSATGDSLGQNYRSPRAAVESGADIVIVGRGITEAANRAEAARAYQEAAWAAYLACVAHH